MVATQNVCNEQMHFIYIYNIYIYSHDLNLSSCHSMISDM